MLHKQSPIFCMTALCTVNYEVSNKNEKKKLPQTNRKNNEAVLQEADGNHKLIREIRC